MLSFEVVMLVLCLGAAWVWLDGNRAREAGMRAARDSCAREGVQLLDDTVSCRSLRLGRNAKGHLAVRRVYDFEYSSSGDDRFRGSVMLLGHEVELLDVSEHHKRGWVM